VTVLTIGNLADRHTRSGVGVYWKRVTKLKEAQNQWPLGLRESRNIALAKMSGTEPPGSEGMLSHSEFGDMEPDVAAEISEAQALVEQQMGEYPEEAI
jgi:hypothetical protein